MFDTSTERGRRKVNKADAVTVVLHWSLVVTVLVSLSTGLRISADGEDSVWAHALSAVQLQGDVMRWHVWSALGLTVVGIAYVVFLARARLLSRVAVDRARIGAIGSAEHESRWSAINVVIYWLAFALIAGAAVTGTLLYFFSGALPHGTVIAVHRVIAWMFIGYLALHVVTQLAATGLRGLLKIMNPRAAYGAAAVTALGVAGVSAATIYAVDQAVVKELQVKMVASAPELDGDSSDPAWSEARVTEIPTIRGINQPGGEVTVRIRAVHDGSRLYTLFEWPDSTRSQKHLPLIKGKDGWKVVQKEFGIQDEDDFYEDKFAVMLARSPSLAGAGSTHLGPKPLGGKPGSAGGRGLHYTEDGSIVDVWHWKSVRTGATGSHQADDNYFGPPMEPNPKKKRYTGGYTQDPHTGGGYKMNWEKFSDGVVRPLRLPNDPSVLERLGSVDLDPNVSDDGDIWLPMSMTVAYSEELDTYPVGTIMPSVLIDGPRRGDRGDVAAVGRWEDGWWRVEMSRELETGSDYDIGLGNGQPVYLWVAAFDHAQTRHTMHLHPVEVTLE